MNVFIIGGTGFISRAIVRRLLAAGHRVTLFTRGRHPLPQDILGRVETVTGDRRKAKALAGAVAGRSFDAAIDMVAYVPDDSATAVSSLKGYVGHFVHCSTVSVYMISHDVRCPVTEDQANRPLMEFWPANPFGMEYGIEKRQCEDLLWKAHDERHFPVTVLRPTFVSGPEDPSARDWFWIERLRDGRPLLVPGSGDHAFQQVFVEDVARAFVAALDHPRSIGKAYNVAATEILSLDEYLYALGALMNREPQLVHIPQEVFDRLPLSSSKVGDVFPFNTRRTAIFSLELARNDLDYQTTPFDSWMRQTIDWWSAPGRPHSTGYERRSEELALAAKQQATGAASP